MNTFHILGTMQSALKTPFIQSQKSRRLMVISSPFKARSPRLRKVKDLPEITKLVSGSREARNRMSWLHHFCTLLPLAKLSTSGDLSWQDASILQWRPMHCSVIPSVWRCRCTSFVTEHLTAWRETGNTCPEMFTLLHSKEWRIYLLLSFQFFMNVFYFFTSEAIFIMLGESFFCSHSF